MNKRSAPPNFPAVLAAAISLTLIMGCADQTTAPEALVLDGPSFARVPTLELPWKGNLMATVTSVQWAGDPWTPAHTSDFGGRCSRASTYVMHGVLVGEVTVLGRVTFHFSMCGQFGVGYTDSRWFGVAADGSALWGSGAVGDGGVIGFDLDTRQYWTFDEWEIEGGTGRFAGATGGGWQRAVFNDPVALLSGQESYQMYQEGTIRLTPGKGNVPNLVPFKGTGTWWYVDEGDPSPCLEDFEDPFSAVIPVFSEGEGTNTQLGRLKVAVTQCYGWDGSLPPAPVFLSHSVTWTAANGDQLLGYGSIYDDPPIMATHDGVTYELVPIRFVGGTGRFRNAEGWFRVTGDFSMEAGAGGNYVTEGWISSVGSKR